MLTFKSMLNCIHKNSPCQLQLPHNLAVNNLYRCEIHHKTAVYLIFRIGKANTLVLFLCQLHKVFGVTYITSRSC